LIIPLETVIVDNRARDGTWCAKYYDGHPKGCPNFPDCPLKRVHFNTLRGYDWYAVVEPFDLKSHAEKMKQKHPNWSERQCRNLLYWQNGVRSRLRKKAEKFAMPLMGDIILDIPEAHGVQVFDTMEKHGLVLERKKPDIIHKIMLVGKRNSMSTEDTSSLRSEPK